MMNKSKLLVLGLCTVLTMCMTFSVVSKAESSCLSVRDYGEHRYNHRTYYTISETAEVQGINEQGYIHSIVTKVTWGECVCGLQGRWTEKRDVYTPVP